MTYFDWPRRLQGSSRLDGFFGAVNIQKKKLKRCARMKQHGARNVRRGGFSPSPVPIDRPIPDWWDAVGNSATF
jgi:hypothetical protein